MEGKVTLLDFWPSSFGMRVRIALAEKGIEYEAKEENLFGKSSLLLEMNPVHKKIPVLIHNGQPICESLVIVQYIDEVWNEKCPLLPSDPYQRSQAKFWADYIDKNIYPIGRRVWSGKGDEEHEVAKKEFIQVLKTLEGELGEKAYFGGENFGFLDVALVPFTSWFYTYETCANFSIERECLLSLLHGLRGAWRERVSQSLSLTLTKYMDTFCSLRKYLAWSKLSQCLVHKVMHCFMYYFVLFFVTLISFLLSFLLPSSFPLFRQCPGLVREEAL